MAIEVDKMFDVRVVKHYPYRAAMVRERLAVIPRELVRDFEEHLATKSGVRPDNHTCYTLTDMYDQTFSVMFHDFVCIFGKSVEERRW